MDAAHIAACSFDAWYPSFHDVTFESAVLPLPPDLTDFLVQDGVFLPSSSAAVCSSYARQRHLCDAAQRPCSCLMPSNNTSWLRIICLVATLSKLTPVWLLAAAEAV